MICSIECQWKQHGLLCHQYNHRKTLCRKPVTFHSRARKPLPSSRPLTTFPISQNNHSLSSECREKKEKKRTLKCDLQGSRFDSLLLTFCYPISKNYLLRRGKTYSAKTTTSSILLLGDSRLCGIGTGDDFFPCNNSAISLTNNILLCIEDSPSSEVSSFSSLI